MKFEQIVGEQSQSLHLVQTCVDLYVLNINIWTSGRRIALVKAFSHRQSALEKECAFQKRMNVFQTRVL